MGKRSYKGERPTFYLSCSIHRSHHLWELPDPWRYALANFGMVLPRSTSPPCPHSARHPCLPWYLAIHWHDLRLPSSPLQTSSGISFDHQQHHIWSADRYHHLDDSPVRIL